MIDTIVLRIHGYEKYRHLVNQLKTNISDDYTVKFIHEGLQDTSKTSILFGDTGRILPVSIRTSINVPSSHYNISVYPNQGRDYIEINMSIPKFLYSTNVLQFIDVHNTGINYIFDKMKYTISQFFNRYFSMPPDWLDVEINRIDLCYNQIFLSKADALRYLEEQRTLNIHNARSDKNKFQSYGTTTVQYHTDNYSFKIYHKGTEFRKNDLNKLLKQNPKNLDLSELTDVADKILRYEISCKKGLMNYCFRKSVKDDQNTIFNHLYEEIRKSKVRKSYSFKNNMKVSIYTKSSNQIDLFINKTINNKSFGFHLDSHWENIHSKPIDLLECFNLCFNVELFTALHSFFWERVQRYQLGVKMGIREIFDKIQDKKTAKDLKAEIHGKTEQSANTSQMLLLAALSQYTDISDLKGIIPKATYYRYDKKLKDLGIPRHSPDIAVNPPPLDYQMYFFYFAKYH